MKRTFAALLLASSLAARAQAGPDDVYVRAFSLIEEATNASKSNQLRSAYDKFTEAQTVLKGIQQSSPNWNPTIVQLRLAQVEEALQGLKGKLPADATPAPIKPVVPDSSSPAALIQQIQYLQAQNAALEGKLKEALSVQSGTLSIAEKARLEGELGKLTKEQEVLKVSLTQEKDRAAAAEAKAKEFETLAADGKKLRETAKAKAQLEDSVKDLGRQVARLQDAAKADAEKSADAIKAAEAKVAAVSRQNDDLKARLNDSESRLAALSTVEAKSRGLASEKADLEKQVAKLKAELAEKPKASEPSPALAAEITSLKAQLKSARESHEAAETRVAGLTKQLKSAEESATKDSAKQIKQLQGDLADTQKKLASTESKLREATTKRKGSAAEQKIGELQAKIDALEAKPAPYSKEEQALIKTSSGSPVVVVSATNNPATEKKSVRRIPPGAGTLVAEAERAFAGRRFAEAEQKFAAALSQDDNNVYLLSNVAAAQFEQGKLQDCEKNLLKALAADAEDPASLTLLGILRFRQDRFDDALTALSKSAQLSPNNADTQNYLGITLSQKGQRTAAEAALRKSLQLQADNPAAHHNLAIIYATQKPAFIELARFHYGKALSLGHPKNAELEKALDAAK